jgi:hypothetical protein
MPFILNLQNGVDLASVSSFDRTDGQIRFDATPFVEAASVDSSANGPLGVCSKKPVSGQLGLGTAQVQFSKVGHVKHRHLVATRAALLTDLHVHTRLRLMEKCDAAAGECNFSGDLSLVIACALALVTFPCRIMDFVAYLL